MNTITPTPVLPAPPAKTSNGAPHLEVDATREKLVALGLGHAAEALGEELSEAIKHNRPAHVVLERLLSCEVGARDERRVKTSLKLSNLPPGMTLGNFDFGFQPSIEKRQIETLATGAFIREHTTLLVQGPPGVGKTHMVVGLVLAALWHEATFAGWHGPRRGSRIADHAKRFSEKSE
jgi:DNA replication protein DnaC